MKKLFIATIILCLLPISASWAQSVPAYGSATFGCNFNASGGNGVFGASLGANIPIYTDTVKGFTCMNRTQYWYAGHDAEYRVQAVATWLVYQQKIKDWMFAIGNGVSINIKDGGDEPMAGVMIEVGYNILGSLTVKIGGDHKLISGRKGNTYLYAGLDLLP